MLYLIEEEQKERPYLLYRKQPNGEIVLWSTNRVRLSAIAHAKSEAKRLNEAIKLYIKRRKQ